MEQRTDTLLSDTEQKNLRSSGIISDVEVALLVGDITIAENVVTRIRRVIGKTNQVTEGRRVLKD